MEIQNGRQYGRQNGKNSIRIPVQTIKSCHTLSVVFYFVCLKHLTQPYLQYVYV